MILANALGVGPEDILFGRPALIYDLGAAGLIPLANRQIQMVPLICWVQAGEFSHPDGLKLPEEELEYYACPNPKAGLRTFALTVRGDSMTNPHGGRPGDRLSGRWQLYL